MGIDLTGLTPACATPMNDDESLDIPSFKRHIRQLESVDGVTGIVCNANAGEVAYLTEDERSELIEVADEITNETTPVLSGVTGTRTDDVRESARGVEASGADAILLLPPPGNRTDQTVRYFREISEGVNIPIVAFQLPSHFYGRLSRDSLLDVVQVDSVHAVKIATWDVGKFEDDVRAVREAAPDITILTGNDEYLLPCYTLNDVDGGLLGLGAAVPEEIVTLFNAIDQNNINRAQEIYDRLNPLVEAIYRPEVSPESHSRMKTLLHLQGKIDTAIPRRPSLPTPEQKIEELKTTAKLANVL